MLGKPTVTFLGWFCCGFIALVAFSILVVELALGPPRSHDWPGYLIALGIATVSHVTVLFGGLPLMALPSGTSNARRLGLVAAMLDCAIMISLLAGLRTLERLGYGGIWEMFAIFLIVFFLAPLLTIFAVKMVVHGDTHGR
jgi:hypothetical protein